MTPGEKTAVDEQALTLDYIEAIADMTAEYIVARRDPDGIVVNALHAMSLLASRGAESIRALP